ncbi:MAG: TlpA family protein disulfide reductase [Phycisphaera sp.]|nr:MAG: TlpA family protein disulfide reductase [Phycisphaera sp.]
MTMSDRLRRLTSLSGAATVAVALTMTGAVSSPALGQNQGQAPGQMVGDHRPAEQIIEAYEAVEIPAYDASRRGEEGYRAEYMAARNEAMLEQAELIGELHRSHPAHDRLPELLPVRWNAMMGAGSADSVLAETRELAGRTDNKELKTEALFAHANAVARSTNYDSEKVGEAAELFAAVAPDDARNATLLMMTTYYQTDGKLLEQTLRTIAADYPDTREGGQAKAKVYHYDQVGKPFELSFEEATSGEPIDMSMLRGKVVVIDFWATWCGPCIAEMPHMKKLYAAYKDKGVEFVGISLDSPRNEEDPSKDGLVKLRNYVEANDVAWPQYYQGNGWKSEFSSNWQIRSIPAIFVVDQQGRLHSPNARGKLDEMIPEMLGIDPIALEEENTEEG